MSPVAGKFLMESFYDYVDTKLLKGSNNKTIGRSFRSQSVGVCSWKSLSVWLHGKISPGERGKDRDSSHEVVYARFKKLMFQNMLANFNPDKDFKATVGNEEYAVFFKAELARKIQKMDAKIKDLTLKNIDRLT